MQHILDFGQPFYFKSKIRMKWAEKEELCEEKSDNSENNIISTIKTDNIKEIDIKNENNKNYKKIQINNSFFRL